MERGHAEALAPMVKQVMTEAGVPFSALERIVVTIGPGTFTGVRIGLAMARGLGIVARHTGHRHRHANGHRRQYASWRPATAGRSGCAERGSLCGALPRRQNGDAAHCLYHRNIVDGASAGAAPHIRHRCRSRHLPERAKRFRTHQRCRSSRRRQIRPAWSASPYARPECPSRFISARPMPSRRFRPIQSVYGISTPAILPSSPPSTPNVSKRRGVRKPLPS